MESVWSNSVNFEKRKPLERDISVDTLVIGAGLAGILTAYKLKEKGVECAVIEANEICSGQTKNTTAKITSQHADIYSKIQKYYGTEFAKQYARANENAIREYEKIIKERNIACDFENKEAYLYSVSDLNTLQKETECAANAGIDCYFTENLTLPFYTRGSVVFKNQAQFNPLKFICGILPELRIYEHTRAIRIVENTVYTEMEKITAKNIVVATHYPFVNFPSLYFLKMSSERSYVLALKNTNFPCEGMCIGVEDGSLSLRKYKDLILLGGGMHRTGVTGKEPPFNMLERKAREFFPESRVVSRWSAQDCVTIDEIPYIGKFDGKNPHIFVTTGFNKWGMTTSMVGAEIISDKIIGVKNDNSQVFSPNRFKFSASSKNICENISETVKGFASHLCIPLKDIRNIETGAGTEIYYDGKTAGAYKDTDDKIYVVSLTCPHLKCRLKWNQTAKTWECPCHGSRYSFKGELIDNPAQTGSILLEIK